MSKNPKLTIAVAFLITFLIGLGAGYLLGGKMHQTVADQRIIDTDESERVYTEDMLRRGEREPRIDRDTREESRELYRDEERREERDRLDRYREQDRQEARPGWDDNRLKRRLTRDLELTEETADELFSVLIHHRELGKEMFFEHRQTFQDNFRQLQEQLENDVAEILTEEQMEIWLEKYSPWQNGMHRGPESQRGRER